MNLLQSGEWLDLTLSLSAARREAADRGAIERVGGARGRADARRASPAGSALSPMRADRGRVVS
jgi:hypothetical protein